MLKIVSSIWIFLFGRFSWTPPIWLKLLLKPFVFAFSSIRSGIIAFYQKSRKLFFAVTFGIIILIGGSGYGILYYLNLPQPVKIRVEISEITPTPLEKDAIPDRLFIDFGGSAAPLDKVGKIIGEGIIMNPQLEGEWKWEDDRQLSFTVKGDWPVDQDISIKFTKGLIPDHVHLETDEVEVNTPKFQLIIDSHELYQNPQLQNEKKIAATVRFTHPVDPKSFEERILFEYGKNTRNKDWKHLNQKLNFEVSYDDYFGEAYIHSETIALPSFEEDVKLVIQKGVVSSIKGSNSSGEAVSHAAIPGMYSFFKVSEADLTFVRNEQYEPEQVLVVNTTARVAQEELMNYLELFLLPVNRPKTPGRDVVRNYDDWHESEIGNLILQRSRKINLLPIPTEHRYSDLQSFKYRVEPGRFLYLRIKKGAESFGGYILAKEFDSVFKVPEYPRELTVMQEGSLLSLSGEKTISIAAREMEGIRYRVGRLLPGQLAHLITQTYGSLSEVYFRNWDLDEKNITEIFTEYSTLPYVGRGKTQYTSFDFSRYLGKTGHPRGIFLFEVQGWNKHRKRTSGEPDKRLVMITDLGIIVKTSVTLKSDVFVQSIKTGLPVPHCVISVLGTNGRIIFSRLTDSEGKASFPDLRDFKHEKAPIAFLAIKEGDLSFIPIKSHVSEVDYSQFDTGGVYSHYVSEKLNAYLFSDRGIYRPGEEINIGMIVKAPNWRRSLKGIPLEVIVTDPRGLTIRNEKISLSKLGFEEYRFSTRETAITGTYDVALYLLKEDGRHESKLGNRPVKVEEFMPDRIKISAKFSVPTNIGWVSPDNLKGLVNLQNLFGTPAQERRITGEIILRPSYPSFRQYKEYKFYDPLRSKESYSQVLTEQISDEHGNAGFDLELNKYERATYLLRFYSQGFEAEGGRSVSASTSVLVSPLKTLVGYKAEGSLDYISKDSRIAVSFISINSDLEQTDTGNLFLELLEVKRVSTLVKQDNGTYKYESIEKEYPLSRSEFDIKREGTDYRLSTDTPGDFMVVLKDQSDVELNRLRYSVMGSTNIAHDMEKNAELQVKLDKADYDPDEEIQISIRAPYTGSGLITIERDQVYAHKWFKSDKTSTVQTITVPPGLEGNAYVNVTFVRDADSAEIFMSPMSTGVVPFSISKANRINPITLELPDLIKPGQSMEIRYKTRHRAKIIIFAVDEGILQVAGYRNPDPLKHFFRKRALEVSTRQIMDLILPEYSVIRKKVLEPGGGAMALLGKNLNPFKRKMDKAVVFWSGLLDSGLKERSLKVGIPDYFNGRLRVMAVAVSAGAMDAVSDKVIVRGPFVLSPNVPTFVSPSDKFRVSVGVSNNVKGSGENAEIELKIDSGNHFQIVGDAVQTIKISENGEKSVVFDLTANDLLGNGEIRFVASHNNERTQRTATASIRPATPYRTDIKAGYVTAGSEKKIEVLRPMFNRFRTNEVGISFVPLGLSGGLLQYLKSYPYGCTEQVVSKSIPLLVLKDRPEFGISSAETKEQLEATIQILRNRQNSEGEISVWDNSASGSVFHTAYAMHFLTEARERNIGIPRQLFLKGLRYLDSYSKIEPKDMADARVKAYAIYILTRNSGITTKALASLKRWLESYHKTGQKEDVVTLYLAASYKMLQMDREAVALARSFVRGSSVEVNYDMYLYDRLIRDATYLYLVSRHFPELLSEIDEKLIVDLVDPLLKNDYNSISSAISIMAFDAYAEVSGAPNPVNFKVIESNREGLNNQLTLEGGLFAKTGFSELAANLVVGNNSNQLLFYSAVQSGFDKTPASTPINDKIEVIREYTDENGKVVTEVNQGDEIHVHLKFRSISSQQYYNVVLIDLLPGGFEIVMDSLDREAGVDNLDAREDRVLIFTTFGKDLSEISYRIKATNKGTYLVPPALAKSMYDTQVQSRSVTGEIVVK